MLTNSNRIRQIKTGSSQKGNVVYWMSRDQRLNDNWALYYAYELAAARQTKLSIVFVLRTKFLGGLQRNFDFMLEGLNDLVIRAWRSNIAFYFLLGEPGIELPKYLKQSNSDTVVSDFSPLHIKRKWLKSLEDYDCNIFEIDSHNLVPVWEASSKQEFAARTIRPKIINRVSEFLDLPPEILPKPTSPKKLDFATKIDTTPNELAFDSGEQAASDTLTDFINNKLQNYAHHRNNPNLDSLSNLSPYLHYGQIYIGRIIQKLGSSYQEHLSDFIDEILVRRELADNFCFYNANYNNLNGAPEWARKTLDVHRSDKRQYIYAKDQFEVALTHDTAWNAAQLQMVRTGKMHGYMRMYWAKKILEWTESPEQAISIAIYLNDKYSIDGRDPNGYVGILWSIAGLHDRAWPERPVFGKVRFMNYSGLQKKFTVAEYCSRFSKIGKY